MTAGWDDPTQVDWGAVAGEETEAVADAAPVEEPAPPTAVLKCTAIYSYTVKNINQNNINLALINKKLFAGTKSR